MSHLLRVILIPGLITTALILPACTGLLVGGAGAAVVSTLHDRRTPGTVVDDRNLEIVITKRLLGDKHSYDYSHVNLTIYNGVVLVTGEAATQDITNRIIKNIRSTPNVKQVVSYVEVMPTSSLLDRTRDSAITTKVKTALTSVGLPNFDPTLINVSTERKTVYLMGLVTPNEADVIARRASLVSGVKSVVKVFEYLP
ncbi:MAG: BON domain-containing protein [Gammaproteobacteria bacterium]|nr:MAG: BON domain-containing protein [Gammaproteobacteria bacterium]